MKHFGRKKTDLTDVSIENHTSKIALCGRSIWTKESGNANLNRNIQTGFRSGGSLAPSSQFQCCCDFLICKMNVLKLLFCFEGEKRRNWTLTFLLHHWFCSSHYFYLCLGMVSENCPSFSLLFESYWIWQAEVIDIGSSSCYHQMVESHLFFPSEEWMHDFLFLFLTRRSLALPWPLERG